MYNAYKIIDVSDTVCIDGVYRVERRNHKERRKNVTRMLAYDRRIQRDPRLKHIKQIDELV